MKNKTFNSLLLLIISFFLVAITAIAEEEEGEVIEAYITYGETVDVSAALGMSGETVDSVIDVSKVNGEEILSYNCSGTTCTCQLKDKGLWNMVAHIAVKYANGSVKILNLNIVNYWPARVYLGNYNSDWSYSSSQWESDLNHNANALTITSKTRERINLPTVGTTDVNAYNGLPIKFVNFIRSQEVDQFSYEGSTMAVTLPVQKKNQCQAGGKIGTDSGAFGEPIPAGTEIDGTGPYIYVSCYEYRDVVFLSLSGGTFKNGPTGSWEFNQNINQYMSTSSTQLPAVADISFPWGLASNKRLVAWQNQEGVRKSPGASVEVNGDTWTAIFEYDAMSGTSNDRMVRVGETTKISSSNTRVTSCSAGSSPSGRITTSVDANGICIIKGEEQTSGTDSIQVTVNYEGGESVVYNFTVLGSTNWSDDFVFEPEIEVIGIQDEELGDDDFSFSSCLSWVADNLVTWGSNGTIEGSTVLQAAYYAECDGKRQVGLCLDPGIYGPHGATYVRDTTMDNFMATGAVKKIMHDLITFLNDESNKTAWNSGQTHGPVANYRNGVNTAFRIITMSMGYSYTYSYDNCGGNTSCIESKTFEAAGKELRDHGAAGIPSALSLVYNANPDTNCHAGSLLGQSPYCVSKSYLETYFGYSGSDDGSSTIVTEDFNITKNGEYIDGPGENQYSIRYTGKLKVPSTVSLAGFDPTKVNADGCTKFGYTCEFNITAGPDEDGAYDYEAIIKVDDSSPDKLSIPSTKEEKAAAAIQIPLDITDGNVTDAFVIRPDNAGKRQRLVLFDEASKTLSIYFSPACENGACGNDNGPCDDVTSAMIAACEAELEGKEVHFDASGGIQNDTSLTCNLELIKTCCGLTNEVDHPNLTHKVCSNSCSYNNVGAVCDFYEYGESKVETSTLFHVREGYKYIADNDYEKNLGECIINVNDYAAAANKSEFNVVDAAGNLLNVEAYADNLYCQVTCREDWDLTMGTFGSYMGAEAVRAGGSFQIADADIFIRGDRYCYTTYLNTSSSSAFFTNMKQFAIQVKQGYNAYSNAAHGLNDLSHDAPDGGTGKGKTDDKDYHSIDGGASPNWSGTKYVGGAGSVDTCALWTKVQYYVIDSVDYTCNSCGSGASYDPCCSKTYYVDDYHYDYPIECTASTTKSDSLNTSTGAVTRASELTDKERTGKYVTSIELSGQFNDSDNSGAGKYVHYDESTAVANTNTKEDYSRHKITITCTNHENKVDGGHDSIDCTSSGASLAGATTDEYELGSDDTDDDVRDELNRMIVGYYGTKASAAGGSSDGDGYIYRQYYDQLKEKLQKDMQGAEGVITGGTYSLKAHAKMWYDCENFVLYTADYTGVNLGTTDIENAKSEAHLSNNFKVMGDAGKIVEVGTVFNPKVAYSYDEVVYMNLLSNSKNNINDNILIRNDEKNSSVWSNSSLNSGAKFTEGEVMTSAGDPRTKSFFDPDNLTQNLNVEIPIELTLNPNDSNYTEEDKNNKLSYSKKTNNTYTSSSVWTDEANTKEYKGTELTGTLDSHVKYGSNSSWKISVCYVGTKGTAYKEGDSQTYAPLGNKDDNGWKTGNCYLIGLPYYEDLNYIERGVSNSSFYRNKGFWWQNDNATLVHGDKLDQAITNFNMLTTDGSAAPTDKSLYATMGFKNVFPVSITTPRNLYKYAYVFTNIGSFGGERAGRLMGHENAVFKNNTRVCFYEVIETLCRCCGDANIISHQVQIPGVDEDVTEQFGSQHSDQLGHIHSDPDLVQSSTEGSIGFYNTVSSLANLSAVNESGERTLAANWGEESLFSYNGYNRYVTNKGYVAQKAIEAVGEDIYSPSYSAEYAYRLTPDAISEIKQSNMSNEYGITLDESHVKLYGKVLMVKQPSGSYTSLDNGGELYDAISFGHYGSVFLEQVASKYAKPSSDDGTFKNLNLASRQDKNTNTCYITETGETSADGTTTASNLKTKMQGECRWVDYIDNDGSASSKYMASHTGCDPSADYRCVSEFRLAFK